MRAQCKESPKILARSCHGSKNPRSLACVATNNILLKERESAYFGALALGASNILLENSSKFKFNSTKVALLLSSTVLQIGEEERFQGPTLGPGGMQYKCWGAGVLVWRAAFVQSFPIVGTALPCPREAPHTNPNQH